MTGSQIKIGFYGALWAEEDAWRLRVKFKRTDQASDNEGFRVVEFLVKPEQTTPGSASSEFGILRTFANEQERDAFYASPLFQAWKERIAPLTEGRPRPGA